MPILGSSGGLATVDLLTGDGTVAQVTLPTTVEGVQQGLAPVGTLTGALLGEPAGGAVTQLTDGLAPVVATVTSTVDQVATPLLDTVNTVLSPVTGALGGALGGGGDGAAPALGSLVGATVGGNALIGPSTADTLVGVNLLPSGTAGATGSLATVDVLTQGNLVDVALPATTAAVESGLAPVGNLAGSLLGPQAGAAVDQVTGAVAPVVAAVTSTVDAVASPLLDTVNSLAPALPGGGESSGSPLAPVTGIVGSVLGSGTDGGSVLAPVTGVVNGILAPVTGGTDGATAPVTGLLGGLLGGSR